MKREEIHIRDPFIFPYDNKYYLYGTGVPNASDINVGREFWCYVSEDLEKWSEPIRCFKAPNDFWGTMNFWAPEVHVYKEKFYMFASFYAKGENRATQVLVADNPLGPYKVWSKPLTPSNWMSLDGTLYVEDNTPYLVFCHEWLQVGDGEIAYIPLKGDLSDVDGDARVLFRASESKWAHPIQVEDKQGIVTDGPWVVKNESELLLFWSSFHYGDYAVGMAVSESGKLKGPWRHLDSLLFKENGGHGMMFNAFDGKLYYVLHRPNNFPFERPCLFEIEKAEEGYILKERGNDNETGSSR